MFHLSNYLDLNAKNRSFWHLSPYHSIAYAGMLNHSATKYAQK